MHVYARLLIAGLMTTSLCNTSAKGEPEKHEGFGGAEENRVVVLVLDGVRWQDFFDVPESRLRPEDGAPPPFQGYWKRLSQEGVAFGDRSRGSSARMTLLGPFSQRKSLPSYQAMLAGYAQPCPDNDCARIGVETLPESLARRLNLPPEKVAVFSSWHGLARAAAHKSGSVHVDAGEIGSSGKALGKPTTRDDEKTAELSLNHLRTHSPRFLFVVFDQADNAAHAGDKAGYVRELRRFDKIILWFLEAIDEMELADKNQTTLIVTTDHGRGVFGPLWQYHAAMPYATETFLAATGPQTVHKGHLENHANEIQHSDLRPTVEILLGLEPSPCDHPTCGQPIPEILGENSSSP